MTIFTGLLAMVVIGINLFFISVYVHSLPDHWAVYLMVSVLVLMYIMFVIYLVSKILLNQLGQISKELFCDIFSICVKFCNVEQASFHSFRYIKKIVENKAHHRCGKKYMEVQFRLPVLLLVNIYNLLHLLDYTQEYWCWMLTLMKKNPKFSYLNLHSFVGLVLLG